MRATLYSDWNERTEHSEVGKEGKKAKFFVLQES